MRVHSQPKSPNATNCEQLYSESISPTHCSNERYADDWSVTHLDRNNFNWPCSIVSPLRRSRTRAAHAPPHRRLHVLFQLVQHSRSPERRHSFLVCSNRNHHVPASSAVSPSRLCVCVCVCVLQIVFFASPRLLAIIPVQRYTVVPLFRCYFSLGSLDFLFFLYHTCWCCVCVLFSRHTRLPLFMTMDRCRFARSQSMLIGVVGRGRWIDGEASFVRYIYLLDCTRVCLCVCALYSPVLVELIRACRTVIVGLERIRIQKYSMQRSLALLI